VQDPRAEDLATAPLHRAPVDRHRTVTLVKLVDGGAKLAKVVGTLRPAAAAPGRHHRRQKQACEDTDYRDHDEHFDERKSAAITTSKLEVFHYGPSPECGFDPPADNLITSDDPYSG
jgi:hypothetical protein